MIKKIKQYIRIKKQLKSEIKQLKQERELVSTHTYNLYKLIHILIDQRANLTKIQDGEYRCWKNDMLIVVNKQIDSLINKLK